MMSWLFEKRLKWRFISTLVLHTCLCYFSILPQTSEGASNYSILISYPFQVNLSAVKSVYETRLDELTRTDPSAACLKLFNFNFTQLPVLDIYSPINTLAQVSKSVIDNRTVLFMGYATYFGQMMVGTNFTNDTAYKRSGTSGVYVPQLYKYWFDEQIYLNVINQMLISFQQASTAPLNEKVVIVTYRQQYLQIFPFKQRISLSDLSKGLSNSMSIFYYDDDASGSNLAASISKLSVVTSIVTILNGDDTNSLLQASLKKGLIRWNVRWIICSLEGTMDVKNTLYNDRDSRNVTVLSFGPHPNDTRSSLKTINNTLDAFLYDLSSDVISSLRYLFCPTTFPTLPGNISGITGNTGFIMVTTPQGQTWGAIRTTYIVRMSRGLGDYIQYVGDIQLDGIYSVTSRIPSLPPQRTSLWKRTKPVRIMFYRFEPDNVFKANASLYTNFNDKIEGYMVDLLKELLNRANLTYVFEELSADTGTKDPSTGTWNGILGLIQSGSYDLSSSLLTWSPERAADFDTVRGVMYYSASFLMADSQKASASNLFQFLNPLKLSVWLAVIGVTAGFAIILTILNYFSPNKNSFSLFESFFFSVGSLLHGVTVDPPNRYSGRLMACALWYFSFAIFALYIANYGAILTKEHLRPSITSVSELLQAVPLYTCGTYRPGLIFDTLWSSNNLDERILAKMMAYDFKNATTNDYNFNVTEKVQNGDFIFLDESPINDYRAYKYCLKSTAYFGSFEYVLYLSRNNDLTPILQQHLNSMNYDNTLDRLQAASWPTTTNPDCINNDFLSKWTTFSKTLDSFISTDVISLRIDYMGGIFILMLGGCIISIVLALFEWIFRAAIQKMVLSSTRRRNRQFLSET